MGVLLYPTMSHNSQTFGCVHPAAKMLVDIPRAQDAEVGDGTITAGHHSYRRIVEGIGTLIEAWEFRPIS